MYRPTPEQAIELPEADMTNWEDGVYPRRETCPHCGSDNSVVAIHGAIRQWWCQDCKRPFMPDL
ncbi:MAG: hypothetical protein DRI26_06645 [Chloroflexi bacterium]|nr:MAG: hypothetical protein DRI26_06645 [Chloroflexota bacterium]